MNKTEYKTYIETIKAKRASLRAAISRELASWQWWATNVTDDYDTGLIKTALELIGFYANIQFRLFNGENPDGLASACGYYWDTTDSQYYLKPKIVKKLIQTLETNPKS